ncbi:hypothetical protein [Arenimonas caeni]|uniref:hypothetical protein n=1 Tax=Arenimonas caeni TaxID=2058085 RepID=UPI0013B06B5D|nr:hypothetical protein [Arenimonas caeni]
MLGHPFWRLQNVEKLSHANVRDAWKTFLTGIEPDYFVTLTYSIGLPDKAAASSLQFFLRCIFKALPKRIRLRAMGAVCVERTTIGKYAGTHHFHILFARIDDAAKDYESKFKAIAEKAAGRLKTRKNIPLVPPKNIHTVSVWDSDGLADYVTKRGKFPFDRDGLKVWLFDRNGVDHDLPGEESMIWVDTNRDSSDARNHRRRSRYSPVPEPLRYR